MPADRTHEKSNYYFCEICQKTISLKDMTRHEKKHSASRTEHEYACSWPGCTYRSLQKSNVADHYVRSHTVDRPHICGYLGPPPCNLAFSSASGMSKHRKDAHGKQPLNKYAKQPGKLDQYYRHVLSPEEVARRAASSPSVSSSTASSSSTSSSHYRTPTPLLAPRGVPVGDPYESMDLYFSADAISAAQLATIHPAQYAHLPKQAPLDIHSFNTAYVHLPPPETWPDQSPLYGTQSVYGTHQPHASKPQAWPAHNPFRYGFPGDQW